MKALLTLFILIAPILESNSQAFPVEEQKVLKDSFSNFSSETIKARLNELNKKTPIEISHTPELEDLIKKYLKEKKKLFRSKHRTYELLFFNI